MDFGTMLEGFRFGAPGSPSPLKRAKTALKPTLATKTEDDALSWYVSDSEEDDVVGTDDGTDAGTSKGTPKTVHVDMQPHVKEQNAKVEKDERKASGKAVEDEKRKEDGTDEREEIKDYQLTYGDCVDVDEVFMRATGTTNKLASTSTSSNYFFLPKGHPGRPPDPPPDEWKEVLTIIKSHRSQQAPAPVDAFHDFLLSLQNKPDAHFQALVASLLSVQCRDSVAMLATKKLRESLGGEITVRAVYETSIEEIAESISTCNFKNSKARYVKRCAGMVKLRFKNKVPCTISELKKLPGVGPKLARLVNSVAFGDDTGGVVVDTHVRRVASRLGWTDSVTKTSAEKTRIRLQEFLPQEEWSDTTLVLIGFGQVTCLPRTPKCAECPVNEKCPSRIDKCEKEKKDYQLPDVEDL